MKRKGAMLLAFGSLLAVLLWALPLADRLRLSDIAPNPDLLSYTITGQIVACDGGSVISKTTEAVTLGAHRNLEVDLRTDVSREKTVSALKERSEARKQEAEIVTLGAHRKVDVD